jgi:hypothetical protein
MATRPDYILPKAARVGCWILAGLFFYALYTRGLLADVGLLRQQGFHFRSAWTALGNAVWQNPNAIAVIGEHPDFDKTLWASTIPAAVGGLPLVILALARKRILIGLVLLLSILPASLAVIFIDAGIGYEDPNDYLALNRNTSFIAAASLEQFLGFTLPAIVYSFLFCGIALYLLRWLVLRLKAIQSSPSHDPMP